MEFRILGPLEVAAAGRAISIAGAKQRALLAILLLNANRVVASDSLIELLWDGRPPDTARKALQVYVSQLRKALGGDRLQTRRPGYVLRVERDELDLARFERLQREGRLDEALALWRGPVLGEFAYEQFAQAEIARLEDLRLACLAARIERDLGGGRHAEVAVELEALVEEHPLREELRRQLMLALYRSGRQAEALEVYRAARTQLVEELGIEPGKSLRELHQAILRQDPALERPTAEPVAAASLPSVFVGRDAELGALLGGLEDAIAGRGRLFFLGGEPGIGKTRLADELIRHARTRAAHVLVGRCWEAGGAPAYWPWVQALRAYVRATDPQTLREQLGPGATDVAQVLPELRELLPELAEPPSLDPEGARFRLFDATAQFVRSASAVRPMVLVLDDLHAADVPSLLLLQFLARELETTHALLVAAYRDVDPIPDGPLRTMLAEVAREPVTRRISLSGLTEAAVAEYVQLAGPEMASQELAVALHEETEGNPLFVSETVRLLAVEDVRLDGSGARLRIPQSVRDVISRRLAHLSSECNRILVLASVLGSEFALDTLARVSALPEAELLDRLDEAMQARVVSDVPGAPGRLRFAHVLVRDTLYEGETAVRRVGLHRLTVAALEALYGDESVPHLAELTNHAIAGSDFDKALVYAQRAGDRALAQLAYEEAARLYRTALDTMDLAGSSDERARCELLLSLGEAEARAGNTPAGRTAFAEAAEIAQRLGLAQELARAAAGYGGRIVWGRAGADRRLVPLLEAGLAALGDDDVELRARLLARLAGALRDEHSRDRRDQVSGEAVELARRTGNAAALAYALDGRAAAIVGPDTVDERLALADELIAIARQIADSERVVGGHNHRLIAHLETGDLRAADADLAEATRIAEEMRQPAQLWQVTSSRALLAMTAGRLDEAEQLAARALTLGEHAQPGAVPVYQLQRYALCEFRGRLAEVEPAVVELSVQHPARPVFRCALAHLYARLGRTEEARRVHDELAQDAYSPLPFDQEWLFGMCLLAETSALLRDARSASAEYALLQPWAERNAVDLGEGIRGSVARYLGLLAATLEHWDDARTHFDAALEMNERMGARPWLAHTQADYARMLYELGATERASSLLAAALSTYRELGMKSSVADMQALAVAKGS
jgi:DNA-binding SARP family transcriptional activator